MKSKETKYQMDSIKKKLISYDKAPIKLMEVCGSHTAAIAKNGIKTMLSDKLRLVSGPGCPVCVTPTAYIDKLIELAKEENTCVVTFGDLIRVPGSKESLSEAKSEGAAVRMVYSPMDTIKLAKENPDMRYVFAAVGFETTTPIYALLIERLIKEHIENVKILTALKTMPVALDWLMKNHAEVDGFLAPGHVCAVTGSDAFVPVAEKYNIPMAVAGFKPEELLIAIYGLVHRVEKLRSDRTQTTDLHSSDIGAYVDNFYTSVVTAEGNLTAQDKVNHYFEKCDASWRGMGIIEDSGMILRPEYQQYDAGSRALTQDHKKNKACQCDKVLLGKTEPHQCPLFGKACTPQTPQGACMVSSEGSCCTHYISGI